MYIEFWIEFAIDSLKIHQVSFPLII